MRAGLARGFSVPRATLEGRDASVAAFLADDVAKKPFHKAVRHHAGDHPGCRAAGAAGRRRGGDPRCGRSRPIASCSISIRTEYLPKTRTTVSAHDLPDGDAFYRAQIREYTTLDLSPEEIHQLGLKEVARIEAEMRQTMRDSGFKGSFEDFLKFLKTDPQFVAKTPDELMGVSSYVAKRTDNVIGNYFGKLCRGGGSGSSLSPMRWRLSTPRAAAGLENCHDEHLQSAGSRRSTTSPR